MGLTRLAEHLPTDVLLDVQPDRRGRTYSRSETSTPRWGREHAHCDECSHCWLERSSRPSERCLAIIGIGHKISAPGKLKVLACDNMENRHRNTFPRMRMTGVSTRRNIFDQAKQEEASPRHGCTASPRSTADGCPCVGAPWRRPRRWSQILELWKPTSRQRSPHRIACRGC